MEVLNEEVKYKAIEYLRDKNKLKHLIKRAEVKVDNKEASKGFVQDTWDNLKTMMELIKAYIKGDYRNIPYGSLVLIVGAIIYFVMPIDAVPDVLFALGFTDDAAVIALTLRKVKKDLDKFAAWKGELEKKDMDGKV
ncbi:YkvA family protein [Sutcliffiella deserti]|uniref:YkvA family protein n=1 Tax=Sutcliffiella deserti TaxID=2875501 RepID=UPI001CBE7524|nr:YkvA family protein [Sutcliffiella deserti]